LRWRDFGFLHGHLRQTWTVKDDIPRAATAPASEVLSPAEVAASLDAGMPSRQRVILTVCYAAGLRVSEAIRLKAAAIDSQRMASAWRQAKGGKIVT